jgi:hypothetical protein
MQSSDNIVNRVAGGSTMVPTIDELPSKRTWLSDERLMPIDTADLLADDYKREPPEWILIPGGFLRSKLAGAL